MKKPSNTKRLQLDTQVVRALDDATLTKAQGGGSGGAGKCPSGANNFCTGCCTVAIHI